MAEKLYEVHWMAESEIHKPHVPEQNCPCNPKLSIDGVWVHQPMKGH